MNTGCTSYSCSGWQARAKAIRDRDSNRCRGCNRSGDDVRIEVHHRRYGRPGASCGECWLLGVADDDLTTLCVDCHDAITNVRRRLRYDDQEPMPVPVVQAPVAVMPVIRARRDVPLIPVDVPITPRPIIRTKVPTVEVVPIGEPQFIPSATVKRTVQ